MMLMILTTQTVQTTPISKHLSITSLLQQAMLPVATATGIANFGGEATAFSNIRMQSTNSGTEIVEIPTILLNRRLKNCQTSFLCALLVPKCTIVSFLAKSSVMPLSKAKACHTRPKIPRTFYMCKKLGQSFFQITRRTSHSCATTWKYMAAPSQKYKYFTYFLSTLRSFPSQSAKKI